MIFAVRSRLQVANNIEYFGSAYVSSQWSEIAFRLFFFRLFGNLSHTVNVGFENFVELNGGVFGNIVHTYPLTTENRFTVFFIYVYKLTYYGSAAIGIHYVVAEQNSERLAVYEIFSQSDRACGAVLNFLQNVGKFSHFARFFYRFQKIEFPLAFKYVFQLGRRIEMTFYYFFFIPYHE